MSDLTDGEKWGLMATGALTLQALANSEARRRRHEKRMELLAAGKPIPPELQERYDSVAQMQPRDAQTHPANDSPEKPTSFGDGLLNVLWLVALILLILIVILFVTVR